MHRQLARHEHSCYIQPSLDPANLAAELQTAVLLLLQSFQRL
jgi:hypothetical protein